MRSGVVYTLKDLNYMLRRSSNYAAGSAPVDGYREGAFSVNKPGDTTAPTSDQEKDKVGIDYDNDGVFPFAFEDDDALSVSRYSKAIPITGALARAEYNTKNDLNCFWKSESGTAGQLTSPAGGIEIIIWGTLVAVGHAGRARR